MSTVIKFPLKPSNALILLNGNKYTSSFLNKHISHYEVVIICDGAYNYACKYFDLDLLDNVVVLGDGDSISHKPDNFITLYNQNYSDFQKALKYLENFYPDIKDVDVFWGSGGEQDHFLGNLIIVANSSITCHYYHYQAQLEQKDYYQAQSEQYIRLISGKNFIKNAQGKNISLLPFPCATVVKSLGLKYEMNNFDISINGDFSLRNSVETQEASIELTGACLMVISC